VISLSIKEIKKRENEQRREYILDKAEKLFFSLDYDNVSMNQIAQEVGLNKATLYLYFNNKESIYFAIVLRGVRIFKEILKNKVEMGKTGINKLEEAGRAYFEFYQKYPHYHDAYLYFKSKRFKDSADEYALQIKALTRDMMIIICSSIQEGVEDGTIRKDVKPIEVAVFVAVTAERIVSLGSTTLKVLESQNISHEQFMEDSLGLWKNMVRETTMK